MKIPISVMVRLLFSAPLAPAQKRRCIKVYCIPSHAMEPTLNVDDRIWTTTLPYQKGDPQRGELAIMEMRTTEISPQSHDANKTVDMVKRVVAVPGDRVEIIKRVLTLNGKIQEEPFTQWDDGYSYDMKVVKGLVYSREYDDTGEPGCWTRSGVIVPDKQQAALSRAKSGVLPPSKYLVLGDNRSNSNDSHAFGLVDRAAFKAKVTMRIYPRPVSF